MSLRNRLERLEDPRTPAQRRRDQEAARKRADLDRKLERQIQRDAEERGPAWVADVEEVGERFRRAVEEAREAGRDLVLDPAARVAANEYRSVRDEGRPPWPPEVREIYLKDPEALPLHDCEDCGMDIPCRAGKQGVKGGQVVTLSPFYRYFDQCSACGGKIGYEAYYHKKQREKGEAEEISF